MKTAAELIRNWIRVVVPAEADVPAMITAFHTPGAFQGRDYEIWLAVNPRHEVLRAWRHGSTEGTGGELSDLARSRLAR